MVNPDYVSGIESWRTSMDAEIRREDGLLGLIGLFWLDKGVTTVGSSPDCRVRLPKPAPRLLGAFEFDGTKLTFGADFGQHVEIDGRPVNSTSPQLIQVAGGLGRIRCGELLIGYCPRSRSAWESRSGTAPRIATSHRATGTTSMRNIVVRAHILPLPGSSEDYETGCRGRHPGRLRSRQRLLQAGREDPYTWRHRHRRPVGSSSDSGILPMAYKHIRKAAT